MLNLSLRLYDHSWCRQHAHFNLLKISYLCLREKMPFPFGTKLVKLI
jgi:hypothetical protein